MRLMLRGSILIAVATFALVLVCRLVLCEAVVEKATVPIGEFAGPVLVLDPRNQVVLVRKVDEKWTMTVIKEEIARFFCNPAGHYLYLTRDERWMRGQIGSKDADVPAKCELPTKNFYSAVDLSPDGKRIAFVVEENRDRVSRLKIQNIVDGTVTTIREKPGTGPYLFQMPTWSPDGKTLAYYESEGGIEEPTFVVQQVLPTVGEPKEVAPKSLWTRLSGPDRSEPKWSPDGKRILFEANYTEDFGERSYVVNADGTQLLPLSRSTWFTDRPVRKLPEGLPAEISRGSLWAWDPSGQFYGVVTWDNDGTQRHSVWIIDAKTGQWDRVGRMEWRCLQAIWVNVPVAQTQSR